MTDAKIEQSKEHAPTGEWWAAAELPGGFSAGMTAAVDPDNALESRDFSIFSNVFISACARTEAFEALMSKGEWHPDFDRGVLENTAAAAQSVPIYYLGRSNSNAEDGGRIFKPALHRSERAVHGTLPDANKAFLTELDQRGRAEGLGDLWLDHATASPEGSFDAGYRAAVLAAELHRPPLTVVKFGRADGILWALADASKVLPDPLCTGSEQGRLKAIYSACFEYLHDIWKENAYVPSPLEAFCRAGEEAGFMVSRGDWDTADIISTQRSEVNPSLPLALRMHAPQKFSETAKGAFVTWLHNVA
jgi:hypothetical protein